MPIDTVGFGAQEAPSSYSVEGVVPYTSAGLVYVRAGCRGRASGTSGDGSHYDGGVPWDVTDLKAAVRYPNHTRYTTCFRYTSAGKHIHHESRPSEC